MHIKFKSPDLEKIGLFFVFLPFIYPKGLIEVSSTYKMIFTIWMFFSTFYLLIILFIDVLNNRFANKKIFKVTLVYYIFLLVITILTKKQIGEGLQKMIIAPICFCGSIRYICKNPEKFIDTLANILILFFVLQLTIFNDAIIHIFDNLYHYHFLGHVQIFSQYAILGLLLAFIGKNKYSSQKFKYNCLLLFSILILLYSGTTASLLCLALFFGYIVIRKIMKIIVIRKVTMKLLITLYLFVNVLLIVYALHFSFIYNLNAALTISGRTEIWKQAYKLIINSPLLGYGVYGVEIFPYWSAWTGEGFNYAHNQFVQQLLDGGLLMLILYFVLMFESTRYVDKMKKSKLKGSIYLIIVLIMLVMLIESVTEYLVIFFIFTIIYGISKKCVEEYNKGIIFNS